MNKLKGIIKINKYLTTSTEGDLFFKNKLNIYLSKINTVEKGSVTALRIGNGPMHFIITFPTNDKDLRATTLNPFDI